MGGWQAAGAEVAYTVYISLAVVHGNASDDRQMVWRAGPQIVSAFGCPRRVQLGDKFRAALSLIPPPDCSQSPISVVNLKPPRTALPIMTKLPL